MPSNSICRHRLLVCFIAIGILTAAVFLKVELPLLLGMNLDWERKIESYRWLLHIHAFFGSVALLAAPLQFFSDFRKKHLQLHRRLGRIYALAILVSAPISIYIAFSHLTSDEKWPAAAQGLIWLSTTLAAVHAAMNRQWIMHQIWITRSYALTLTFVLSRLIVDVMKVDISPIIGSGGLIWLCTFFAIFMADVLSAPAYSTRPAALVS